MKKLLLLLPLAIIGTGSMAQIFVHDIVPDSTLTATPGFYSLKPVSGGPEVVIRYFPSPVSVTCGAARRLRNIVQKRLSGKT